MKKLAIIASILVSTLSFAQTDYNKWSAGLSIGSHDGLFPTKTYTRVYQIQHIGANGRFMVNNKCGLMLDVGYDYMDFYDNPINTNYWRTSIQGVINVGNILCFDNWTQRIGLLFHGGAGVSHMWLNKDIRGAIDDEDELFKGIDDMMNYTMGASPQVKLTDMVSLYADLSFTVHSRQTNTWDFREKNPVLENQFNGYLLNTTIGVTVSFGEHDKHIDWSPSNCNSPEPVDNSADDPFEERIKALETKLSDDDNDGVPNVNDLEPDTAEGALVDPQGRTLLDTDGDKIPDADDLCPDIPGVPINNGCPSSDSDGDGVRNDIDDCPDLAGNKTTGCPDIPLDVKIVLNDAMRSVKFESATLTDTAYYFLDNVIDVMREHSDYYLIVAGNTNNLGDEAALVDLSEKRSAEVVRYLVEKGIAANRLKPEGHGPHKPIASNEHPAGRKMNDRIQFTIKFNSKFK